MAVGIGGHPEPLPGRMGQNPGTVDLAGNHDPLKLGQGSRQAIPAGQTLGRWTGCPSQSKVEWAVRVTPPGDPGNHAMLFSPEGQLEPGDRSGDGYFIHPGG